MKRNDQAALNHLKKKTLNDVKQQFFNEKDKVNLELVKSLKEQIYILKAKYIFYVKRWKRKITLKMFLHSPKPSPQEMTLSSSNSKDVIKDHHKNLTLYH